jgi:hypothetical protein
LREMLDSQIFDLFSHGLERPSVLHPLAAVRPLVRIPTD